jgi:hypothetical protein
VRIPSDCFVFHGATLSERVGENIATKVVKGQQYCPLMIEVIGKGSVSDYSSPQSPVFLTR